MPLGAIFSGQNCFFHFIAALWLCIYFIRRVGYLAIEVHIVGVVPVDSFLLE